jgi:hypothetical protein
MIKNKDMVYTFNIHSCSILSEIEVYISKLCNAVHNGDVDLVLDCLHRGADLHYEDDLVSSIYTM